MARVSVGGTCIEAGDWVETMCGRGHEEGAGPGRPTHLLKLHPDLVESSQPVGLRPGHGVLTLGDFRVLFGPETGTKQMGEAWVGSGSSCPARAPALTPLPARLSPLVPSVSFLGPHSFAAQSPQLFTAPQHWPLGTPLTCPDPPLEPFPPIGHFPSLSPTSPGSHL